MATGLWGEWIVEKPESGIVIVTLKTEREGTDKPWLYVWADDSIDESRFERCRELMADEICKFLNGGERPAWLDDFETLEESSDCLVSLSGARLLAIGPLFMSNGIYKSDDTPSGKRLREILVSFLNKP